MIAVVTVAPLRAQGGAERAPVFTTEIRELSFANGMRAVLARTPPVPGRAPRVFVGLYLKYGVPTAVRPELAHLVEHIGANNMPAIVDYTLPPNLVTFGGNAMTRPDYMSFWRTVSPEALPAIIPNRANRVAGVRDDSAIFAREVLRVSSETQRTIDRIGQTGLTASDVMRSVFFGAGIPLAELIDSIKSYDRPTVFAQINRYFRPDNAVLVVAGDVDLDATTDLLRQHLAAYPARSGPGAVAGPAFAPYHGPTIVRDAHASAARLGIGLEAPSRSSADFTAFMVLDQFLLGGREVASDTATITRSIESPLGRRLRAAFGATSVRDDKDYYTGPPWPALASPSYFAAYVEANRQVPTDSLATLASQALAQALTADLTDVAITRAKQELEVFLDRWLMGSDLLHLGDHLAAFALFDRHATRLNSLAREIDAVTPALVRRVAARYRRAGSVRVAVVVPASTP